MKDAGEDRGQWVLWEVGVEVEQLKSERRVAIETVAPKLNSSSDLTKF